MKNLKGSLFLLLAAFIWGTSFAAQSSASNVISPFTFGAVRCAIGGAFLLALIFARKLIRRARGAAQIEINYKRAALAGAVCGVILCAATNLQQLGITLYPADAAASGRSGFLTTTYVVMVAVVSGFLGKKVHPIVWASVMGCVVGMYFLCLKNGFSGAYFADALIILCAVCFATHIMVIDRFSDVDSIVMSCVQFFVCAALSAILMLIFEKPQLSWITGAWFEILYVGVLSSGIAYTLQIAGQKRSSPAVASVIMSSEAVFAALAGWMVLNEKMGGWEIFGAALVFAAVILAQLPDFLHKKNRVSLCV